MGAVPTLLKTRWATNDLVGVAKPACIVRIRQGLMAHAYQAMTMLDTSPDSPSSFPTIWDSDHNAEPWQGQWTPSGDWITLENVQSASWTRDLTSSGVSTLTVVLDDIANVDTTGTAGLYHVFDRGHYSPTKGVPLTGRTTLWTANEWADVFNAGFQIEVWQGYGQGADIVLSEGEDSHWSAPALSRTWVGLIEDCDMESHPDHITLTCTDFGVMLTDQRLMGQNKAKEIKSPVTFADRRKTLGETKETGDVVVSSGSVTIDPRLGVVWTSGTDGSTGDIEWVELHLDAGHYEDFYIDFPYDGETMYVSLFANGGSCLMDGSSLVDGWVNLGLGTVPGAGEQYIAVHSSTVAYPSRRWSLGGHKFDLGDGSKLRLTFTDLANTGGGAYKAGSNSLYAFRFGTDPATITGVKAKGWVLVEDAADVVRTILLWAGFKEFHVENFGWTLDKPLVFGQDAFFIDPINEILAQGNFLFYIDAPTDHDMSLGVPTFQHQTATDAAPGGMLLVRDTQQLEALQVKYDRSNLPYVIRWRGQVSATGVILFEDTSRRFMGTYWPPWSGHDWTYLQGTDFTGTYPLERLGGVRRHFSQTDGATGTAGLGSVAECLFACILTAIQYALASVTGSFQISGLPGVTLNQQVSVIDEGTGTNARMWVASISSTHTLGENGSWHMAIGGSMIDTEDMDFIVDDYEFTRERYLVNKGAT